MNVECLNWFDFAILTVQNLELIQVQELHMILSVSGPVLLYFQRILRYILQTYAK